MRSASASTCWTGWHEPRREGRLDRHRYPGRRMQFVRRHHGRVQFSARVQMRDGIRVVAVDDLRRGCGSARIAAEARAHHPSSGSISGLTTDVQNLKSSVTTLTSNAGSQWHAQTSDLKSALTGLQSAVTSLVKNPSVSAITNVKTEVGKVATAGSNLETTAKSVCD